MTEKPEVLLEELPRSRFIEYLEIFNEAKNNKTLGKVLPPKSLAQMERWHRSGTTFFLVRNKHAHKGVPAGKVLGACGVSRNRLRKKGFTIINMFVKPEFRGLGYGKPMLAAQEAYAKSIGAKRFSAFLYYFDAPQYARFRSSGYLGGKVPSIGHLLKGRLSGKVMKRA